jgi:hypothetical protein
MLGKCVRAIPALCCLLSLSASAGPLPVTTSTLSYRTDWIANTLSNEHGVWAQNNVSAIAVLDDGTVFANTFWDEGGAELSEYKDGKIVRTGKSTHGWGNEGGDAVAANSQYVFAAGGIDNEGGHLKLPYAWPPKGTTWFGVMRRKRADITQGASFPDGVGNLTGSTARSFLVVNASEGPGDFISGLAADDHTLYVSNFLHDEVRVYDADTMQFQRRWTIKRPRHSAIDPHDGSLWVTSFADPDHATLQHFTPEGKPLASSLPLPGETNPSDISATDAHGQARLIVADSGVAQQVYIFNWQNGQYVLGKTEGVKKGVLADPKGETGPLRFDGLTGAAMDGAGNLYVAMNRQGPRPEAEKANVTILGATVASYSPDLKRLWQLESQAFVSAVAFDPKDPSIIWGGNSKFSFDYDKPAGEGWRYTATLLDRFKYPTARMNYRVSPFYRYLDGRPFLFTLDQNGGILTIYRFDPKTDGEVAIPSGFILARDIYDIKSSKFPGHGGIWRDNNGNGKFDPAEWQPDPGAPYADYEPPNWWIDTSGNAWVALGYQGLREFVFKGLDNIGNPIYTQLASQSFPAPQPFNRIQRVHYDVAADQMYLAGNTSEIPYDAANWHEIGPMLVRYDHWSQGNRTPSMTLRLPWVAHGKSTVKMESFDVAGDYIFTINSIGAQVLAFSKKNGQWIGTMVPGAMFGNRSGWIDVSDGLTALKRANGEYIVVAEEVTYGKFIMYRWTPKEAEELAAKANAVP